MEFSILGPVEVRTERGAVEPAAAKVRALLVRLLVDANRAVPADRLVDDLWEGDPPRSAAQTLQTYVSQLRKVLGPDRLVTGSGGYRLVVADGELDADRFEAAVAGGIDALRTGDAGAAGERLRAALDLWRGDALADVGGAAWAAPEIARLGELRLVAIESLLEARLALGDNRGAVASAESAVAEHPLRERLWALLMTALYRDGRQADALRAYQRVRRHLAEELGIEPSRELQDLEGRMLRQDVDAPMPPARDAPAPPLPTGVVTFMLTDVVGSTRLWEMAAPAMADAIARHEQLLQSAVEAHGGVFLKRRGEGDSTFSVFQRVTDAVAAAIDAHRSIAAESWTTPTALEVRIALHTGEAVERDGDYYGRTVNRAARLRAGAVPGQVLLSQATAELAVDGLPEGFRLQTLGVQQLRDLDRPETLYVVAPVGETRIELAVPHQGGVPLPPRVANAPTMGFVGRDDELARVTSAFKEAAAGSRRVVLLAGEPGIGKTSLAAHVARAAHQSGATVLFGRCDDDIGVPYRPWAEALTYYVEHAPRHVLERIGTRQAGDLLSLVPAVADRLPGVVVSRSADAEGDRWSLYRAVTRLLAEIGTDGPAVLVLDDLQWADKPTVVLLRHVVEATADVPLLVVCTYRDRELTGDHPFTELLAALRSDPTTDRLSLRGLDDREVVSLVEGVTGQELADDALDVVHAVYRETDGNPFFVEALLRHLAETGAVFVDDDGRWVVRAELREAGLPESVREVIGHRVGRLGDTCQRVLGVAAVVGQEFDLATVAGALSADEDEVLDALEAAEAAGLVVSIAPGRFGFAHALIATTLYAGITPTRRARLHRTVAGAIEALDAGGARAVELARHWAAATAPADRTKAIEYACRAGDLALRALAPDAAAGWYAQALELLEEQPDAPEAARADLLIRLGRAQRNAGDARHRTTLLDAAALAQRLGDGDLLARAALANTRGYVGTADDVLAERLAMCEAALALQSDEDSVVRARLLATLAAEMRPLSDFERCRSMAEDAVAMARRLDSPPLLAGVLGLALFALWHPDTLTERLALSDEAVRLAEAAGDRGMLHFALNWRAHALAESGDVDGAGRCFESMAAIAEETGHPSLQWTNRAYRAALALLHGDLESAERLGAEAVACARETEAIDATRLRDDQLTMAVWHRGRLAEHAPALRAELARLDDVERASSALRDRLAAAGFPAVSAHSLALHTVPQALFAVALAERGSADELESALRPFHVLDSFSLGWVGFAALWSVVCDRVDSDDDVAALLERLAPYHDQVASAGSVWLGSIAGALAMLATRLGRLDDAARWFAEADEVNERIRAPFFLARTRVAWARMLLGRAGPGDADRAGELLASALAIAREFGCGGVAREAEALLAAPPPLPSRLASAGRSSFVGRTTELAELANAIQSGGRAVLVAGEPGIGKSSLVGAAAARARGDGRWVLYGRADEDLRVPFLPFVEALSQLVTNAPDATLERIGDRHLAELARLVAVVRDRRVVPEPQSTDPETERYLLMNAVLATFVEMSRVAPVVLVLDDLHWADASSVLLLRHLVSGVEGSAVTIVGTYRHTDVVAGSPLAGALPRLRGEPVVRHVTLSGLSSDELADMTGAPPDLADALHRETDGNPFFAGELFRHLQESGADVQSARVPDALRAIVRERVARLGDDVQAVLTAASAIGQEFDLDVLARVVERGALDVAEILERAEAAALVDTVAPERFAFAHAIVQHALYDELPPTRRARTHRTVAAVIAEIDDGNERITELARHWAEAAVTSADVAVAVDYAVRAATHALESLAPDEAIRWYTLALDLLGRQPVPDQHQRCHMLLGLAEAQVRAGDPLFRRTRLQAAELALHLGDTDALVAAALTNYEVAFRASFDPDMLRATEAVLDRLRGVDSPAHARLLAVYADHFQFTDPELCVRIAREARAMAQRLGDPATIAATVVYGGSARQMWQENVEYAELAYRVAREFGDPGIAFLTMRNRWVLSLQAGDREAAEEAHVVLHAIVDEIRRPDQRWVVLMDDALLALLSGELAEAERLTDEAAALGRELRQDGVELLTTALTTSIRWQQGRHVEARPAVAAMARDTPELRILSLPVTMRDASGVDLVEVVRSVPQDAGWLTLVPILADIVARAGDAEAARLLYDDMLPCEHLFAIGGPMCRGSVAHALAVTARTFGDLDAAEAHFTAADDINGRLRAPFFQARTWLEWARMLRERGGAGDDDRAHELLVRGRDVARERGFAQLERRTDRALAGD